MRSFLGARFKGCERFACRVGKVIALEKESAVGQNPLTKLSGFGQSVWLDFLHRRILLSGELKRLIEEDGLRGVTSNPKIFHDAIGRSDAYDQEIRELALEGRSTEEIYWTLAVEDVGAAADLFRPLHEKSAGRDGFVSLEVDPHVARDAMTSIAEARRLWTALARPNVFIKIPGTREGLPAIRQLTSEGINVNVTLLFGIPRYRKVAEAYVAGLEDRAARGEPLDRVASVASLFLSRIDVLIDSELDRIAKAGGAQSGAARRLRGQVAIASAKLAYQAYKEVFGSERFRKLAAKGARPQRVLWASTGTKDPVYSDVKYVEALIGPETVNTMPMETLEAYRDHGEPEARLERDLDRARRVLEEFAEVGIDIDGVTRQLEDEGVEKFNQPYDDLMGTLRKRQAAALAGAVGPQALDLAADSEAFAQQLAVFDQSRFAERLWGKDPALWKGDPESRGMIPNALGWLGVAETMRSRVAELAWFAEEVRRTGFTRVVHMGMGGSSMAPLVLAQAFPDAGGLPLTVLDTTDPATVLAVERSAPLETTLFIVASKSGTTAETLSHGDYFYAKLRGRKGEAAGQNFVAITDPGSRLARLAADRGFRRVFLNFADIGGRYSALSYFGLLPAALLGVDVAELLNRALRMVRACGAAAPAGANPGLELGAALGALARNGRAKLTLLLPDSLSALGLWLEQLIAESTGKEGAGIVPIAGEPVGDAATYRDDRFFVQVGLKGEPDPTPDEVVRRLREAGHPVATIRMADRLDLGQEFFRWEVATAAAGAVLGINPFDQPNVQESKESTNRLLETVARTGALPEEPPALREGPLSLYLGAPAKNATQGLARFLADFTPGGYLAIMAYLTETGDSDRVLRDIRALLRDRLRAATTLGYGPRFLHSTGQLHKGGPDTAVFLQLTADDAEDAEIPGKPYTFGILKRAQALGDLDALRRHGRRVLRVHLGADAAEGLGALKAALDTALDRQRPG